MPVYEYRCAKCGRVSSFMEKMQPDFKLFGRRKRCQHCGSRKLTKIPSAFASSVQRTQIEMLNELKQMGNVQFVPPPPKPPWGDGPPPGGCPYENAEKAKKEAEEAKRKEKERSPIIISG